MSTIPNPLDLLTRENIQSYFQGCATQGTPVGYGGDGGDCPLYHCLMTHGFPSAVHVCDSEIEVFDCGPDNDPWPTMPTRTLPLPVELQRFVSLIDGNFENTEDVPADDALAYLDAAYAGEIEGEE